MERQEAIEWWYKMNLEQKFYKTFEWLKSKGLSVAERHPDSLTGREIEEIYNQQK